MTSILALLAALNSGAIAPAQGSYEKVLVVFSGQGNLGLKEGKSHETGFYLDELATPLAALLQKGFEPVYASPTGKRPVMDKVSDSPSYFSTPEEYVRAKELVEDELGSKPIHKLSELTEADLKSLKGVFVPGGHAPMEDLFRDPDLGKDLRYFHQKKKVTALICHGPVALLSAIERGHPWIYKGYRMTVFSNEEEATTEKGFEGKLKFYAESALKEAGGKVTVGKPWLSNLIRDRELITAQNPMSDKAFARELVGALSK